MPLAVSAVVVTPPWYSIYQPLMEMTFDLESLPIATTPCKRTNTFPRSPKGLWQEGSHGYPPHPPTHSLRTHTGTGEGFNCHIHVQLLQCVRGLWGSCSIDLTHTPRPPWSVLNPVAAETAVACSHLCHVWNRMSLRGLAAIRRNALNTSTRDNTALESSSSVWHSKPLLQYLSQLKYIKIICLPCAFTGCKRNRFVFIIYIILLFINLFSNFH